MPFLSLCYRELHTFDLLGGLLTEYVEHIHAAQRVHALAKGLPNIDMSYCLHSFAHLIRWCFRRNFSTAWEIDTLTHADQIGGKFERTYAGKNELERLFEVAWSFDCPVCDSFDAVVSELDTAKLVDRDVVPKRMACTDCEFVVSRSQPFLSQILLEGQVAKAKSQILKEGSDDIALACLAGVDVSLT